MRSIDETAHAAERNIAIRILNHTFVVDRIFAAHLQSHSHEYTATNTTHTPTLDQLATAIRESDLWYIDFVCDLAPSALSESIDFTFTDGAPGRLTREAMLTHVVLHGGYHRGAVGWIMAQIAIAPPRDVFTRFLHGSELAREERDTGALGV